MQAPYRLCRAGKRVPVQICLDDSGVDIISSANGPRVAELPRTWSTARLTLRAASALELKGPQSANASTANEVPPHVRKSLAVKSAASHSADVFVDVRGCHVSRLTGVIKISKQFLSRQFLALPHDIRQFRIPQVDIVLDPTFPPELEVYLRSLNLGMLIPQRRQAKGVVLAGVFVVAHSDQSRFQQANDGRQYLVARQSSPGQIVFHASPDPRQRLSKGDHPIILYLLARFSPLRVVQVLFAATVVAAGCLQMAVGPWADPDVRPGRRDRQRPNSADDFRVAHWLSVGVNILKASAMATSPYTLVGMGHVTESPAFAA